MGIESMIEENIISLLKDKGYEFKNEENDSWLNNRNFEDFINEPIFNECLQKINKDISNTEIFQNVINQIKNLSSPSLFERNRDFCKLLIKGITVDVKEMDINPLIKLIDFDNPENNVFQVYHQVKYKEGKSTRIPDVVIYINGLPLIVMELKSFSEGEASATLENAYKQLGGNSEQDGYRCDIPTLFNYNSFLVISDGVVSKVGTLTSKFEHYHEWKSINGEPGYDDKYTKKINVLIDGLFDKKRLLDVIKNFIFFIIDKNDKPVKIMAQYHQYFGVNKAFNAVLKAIKPTGDGKAGIVWHTQGSGKSYSMVMLAHKLLQEKTLNVPTIIPLTDRIDLDDQLYKTFFSAKNYLGCQPTIAQSRIDLVKKLSSVKQGGIILTTINKFDKDNLPQNMRNNIIVMTDEAHRSHYGIDEKISLVRNKETNEMEQVSRYGIEKYIRDAIPNATFIGFTGTPISNKDKQTTDIFGDIIDVYDMTQSIIDGATVKLYYEPRLAVIGSDESKIAEIDKYYQDIENSDKADPLSIKKSEEQMAKINLILEQDNVISLFANDILKHYDQQKNFLNGKAMIVCQSRTAAAKLYKEIIKQRPNFSDKVILVATESNKDTAEERKLFGDSNYRKELANEFKKDTSKYKIAIVCDMWLTGFDVPDLSVMYFIKKIKSYNLMQAIARVNRVYPGKSSGLIVDYLGIDKELNDALLEYTNRDRLNNVQDIKKEIYSIFKDKLNELNTLFAKLDKNDFLKKDDIKRFNLIQNGANYVLGEESRTKLFLKLTRDLKDAYSVCHAIVSDAEKNDALYYLTVRSYLQKLSNKPCIISVNEMNNFVQQLLKDAIKGDEVKVLATDQNSLNNVIDILDNKTIDILRKENPPHVFVQIAKKLLEKGIAESQKTTGLKAQEYSEKLSKILEEYNNRNANFNVEQTINNLVSIAHEFHENQEIYKNLGIKGPEKAFYEALIQPIPFKERLNDALLKLIAQEINETVNNYAYADWTQKEATRAKMRTKIKECLKKYKYPVNYLQEATKNIIKQAQYIINL